MLLDPDKVGQRPVIVMTRVFHLLGSSRFSLLMHLIFLVCGHKRPDVTLVILCHLASLA